MSILDKIVNQTRDDIQKRRKKITASDFSGFEDYERDRRDMFKALSRSSGDKLTGETIRIIAEVKKASPSKGVIRDDFSPVKHAADYQENGASAISVLTDEPFFKGHLDYMRDISREVTVPVLRKDFIIDFYQIEEARAYGADAILLIATITTASQLQELHHAATECGLQCLVECYNDEDFSKLSFDQVRIFGVNNRDLNTFSVDLHRGTELLQKAPEGVIRVSESGLSTHQDLCFLADAGIDSALIGETFMKQLNPGEALANILKPN